MPNLKDIYAFLDGKYPFATQGEFDNSGIMCGDTEKEVKKILLSLDVTCPVVEEAEKIGADLIISHHPVIFNGIKSLTYQDVATRPLFMLVSKNIACISAHTNLDAAKGGVNDVLASLVGLENVAGFPLGDGGIDFGRMGDTNLQEPAQFAAFVKKALGCERVELVKAKDTVGKVAVIGGSGSSFLEVAVAAGADTFVTGELKHDAALRALDLGLNVIAAGHYYTENPVMAVLKSELEKQYPNLEVVLTSVHKNPSVAI